MIEAFAIQNFKSLARLHMRLGKFNCLVGMNGAGKSSILQGLDFLAQLMGGRVDDWLAMRQWESSDLHCKFSPRNNIVVRVSYRTASDVRVQWDAEFNRHELYCSSESIMVGGVEQLRVRSRKYRIGGSLEQDIVFKYQGSILSQLDDPRLPPPIVEFRDAMRRVRSLELLAPNLMRKRAREPGEDIGAGGEKLSAFLHGIKGQARDDLLTLLRKFYPNIVDFKVTSQRAGWKKLVLVEKYLDRELETEARHINDGLLRVLAILAQAATDRSLILLDEIENGINPEVVERLVDTLVESPQQIIVTTHSPMILNYLDDAVAKDAVKFIYKTERGETRARPFFGIERIASKLDLMGPGEAFVDTDLAELARDCIALDEKDEAAEAVS